ncbi:MAG: ribulose-phosphate 3-epimerase [Lachnospiraceae bacterium]|nr:ribulose-phosphate 3-epimerase [Lachnospiraceae bacterium]
MDYILSPSLLAADFGDLKSAFEALKKADTKWLHLDVMDGVFVPNLSMGITVISSIRKSTDLFFDVHLMITDPIRYVKDFANAGADLINFHLEACEDPLAVIDEIRKTGKKVGITIKPKTPVEELAPYLGLVDMILIMSVEPGFGGQSFIPTSTEKVRTLRAMLTERGLETDIEIDGGIGLGNIREVLDAGCNIIVIGSAVFKGDIAESAAEFNRILETY